ncbi:MAG: TonB-dependent receptor [Ignavibacteriales bacterium]|nr:TonB-dependent receptor [Ignavibacteriales bacterium]
MQIDQYSEQSFKTINETEKNYDQVFRGRIVYTNVIGDNSLIKIAFNGQSFRHEEKFLSNNFSPLTYSENIFSIGTEYEYVKEKYVVSLGGSYDWLNTPRTGDKSGKDPQSGFAINGAFVYRLQNDLSVRLNLGRKTRFPSLRETFSGALGRFVPNPGLKSEIAHSGEIGFNYKNQFFTADASFFLTYLSDGIVRKSFTGGKFMRVNKDQIRTYGFEFASSYKPDEKVNMVFNFTYLNAKAKNSAGKFDGTLEYKPQLSSSLNFDYMFTTDFSVLAEFEYLAKEYGLKEGSAAFQKLPEYLIVNFRAAYLFLFDKNNKLEFYVRLNNFFDKLYYTQFGLPEAGRQYYFGTNFSL